LLIVLLVLPSAALHAVRAHIDWRVAGCYLVLISLWTYRVYGSDKQRAQQGHWRTPESTLHLLDLAGGWPGALIAQRRHRHKTSKKSFQAIFWITIITHQALAADSLLHFHFAKAAFRKISEAF
jgi:uncharacterized membrane protein YsdA (DUF1294 family)